MARPAGDRGCLSCLAREGKKCDTPALGKQSELARKGSFVRGRLSAQGELVMLCAASTLSLSVAPCPALNVAPSVKHLVNPTYVSSDGVIVSRDLGGCAEKGYFPLRESPPSPPPPPPPSPPEPTSISPCSAADAGPEPCGPGTVANSAERPDEVARRLAERGARVPSPWAAVPAVDLQPRRSASSSRVLQAQELEAA